MQENHSAADSFKHQTNLPFLPFVERNFHSAFTLFKAEDFDLAGRCLSTFDDDALGKLLRLCLGHFFVEHGFINFLHTEPRMCQPIGHTSVVGHEQQPGCILIQPADRVQAFWHILKKIKNRLPAVRIACGCNDSGGLVEHKINHFFPRKLHFAPINADVILVRKNGVRRNADHFVVDLNAALLQNLNHMTSALNARLG